MDAAARELLETQKQLSIQLLAQTRILTALLHSLEPPALQRLKQILAAQAATDEPPGLAADSSRLAVRLVALATEEGDQPDPARMLRLIQGGKQAG